MGDAEVGQLGEPRSRGRLGEDHHVARLDVAVDDPALVGVLEGVAQRHADARDVAVRERTGPQQLGQGSAPNQLGDQVHVVGVGGELVDRDDAGVVEPRCGARLALHAPAALALERDGLDRHLALELLVPGQPDDPEPARAQPALEPVAAEDQPRAGSPGQGFGRVRATQGQGARLLREAGLGTFHLRFRFRVLTGASCPPFILSSTLAGAHGRQEWICFCPSSTNRTSPYAHDVVRPAGRRPIARP